METHNNNNNDHHDYHDHDDEESLEECEVVEEDAERLLEKQLFDTHSHFTDDERFYKGAKGRRTLSRLAGVCAMSTHEGDWIKMQQLPSFFSEEASSSVPLFWVLIGFGIHPWEAYRKRNDREWKERLRKLLIANKGAIVGEVGLDKNAKSPVSNIVEWEKQVEIFQYQFSLAAELQRPVSLHCVNAFGFVFDFLTSLISTPSPGQGSPFPPRIVFHSYSGSLSFAKQLLALEKKINARHRGGKRERNKSSTTTHDPSQKDEEVNTTTMPAVEETRFFFGFSEVINRTPGGTKQEKRLIEVIGGIPKDRILLESDWNAFSFVPASLCSIARFVSSLVMNGDLQATATLTTRNASEAFLISRPQAPTPSPSSPSSPSFSSSS